MEEVFLSKFIVRLPDEDFAGVQLLKPIQDEELDVMMKTPSARWVRYLPNKKSVEEKNYLQNRFSHIRRQETSGDFINVSLSDEYFESCRSHIGFSCEGQKIVKTRKQLVRLTCQGIITCDSGEVQYYKLLGGPTDIHFNKLTDGLIFGGFFSRGNNENNVEVLNLFFSFDQNIWTSSGKNYDPQQFKDFEFLMKKAKSTNFEESSVDATSSSSPTAAPSPSPHVPPKRGGSPVAPPVPSKRSPSPWPFSQEAHQFPLRQEEVPPLPCENANQNPIINGCIAFTEEKINHKIL